MEPAHLTASLHTNFSCPSRTPTLRRRSFVVATGFRPGGGVCETRLVEHQRSHAVLVTSSRLSVGR
jgi:hypothetical protein